MTEVRGPSATPSIPSEITISRNDQNSLVSGLDNAEPDALTSYTALNAFSSLTTTSNRRHPLGRSQSAEPPRSILKNASNDKQQPNRSQSSSSGNKVSFHEFSEVVDFSETTSTSTIQTQKLEAFSLKETKPPAENSRWSSGSSIDTAPAPTIRFQASDNNDDETVSSTNSRWSSGSNIDSAPAPKARLQSADNNVDDTTSSTNSRWSSGNSMDAAPAPKARQPDQQDNISSNATPPRRSVD